MKLQNKVVVITGASRGLGKALAIRFAQEGALISMCARNYEQLRQLSLEIFSNNGKSYFEQVDISDELQIQDFITNTCNNFGNIDILINNASILGSRSPFSEITLAEWKKVIAVNLTGTFLVTKYAIPHFNTSGSIINVSTSVARIGRPFWGAYGVSKFGVEGFTQALGEELKPMKIRVNAVNPGAMNTDMRRLAYPNEISALLKKPEAVTDIFVALASDEFQHITGKTFDAQTFKGIFQ